MSLGERQSQESLWDNRFDIPRGAAEIIYIARCNHLTYEYIQAMLEHHFSASNSKSNAETVRWTIPEINGIKQLWRRIKSAKTWEERRIWADGKAVQVDGEAVEKLLERLPVLSKSCVPDQIYRSKAVGVGDGDGEEDLAEASDDPDS